MLPPWLKFPEIERGSIGWRCGYGEDYYDDFYRWFSSLEPEAQNVQLAEYPEPQSWRGFYQMIIRDPWK